MYQPGDKDKELKWTLECPQKRKLGQVSMEEGKELAQVCRNRIRG